MKFRVLLVSSILSLLLAGCGKQPIKEAMIKEQLQLYASTEVINSDEVINDITIVNRNTDKEIEKDTVWCTINSETDDKVFQRGATLEYSMYDKGWGLSNIIVDPVDNWIIKAKKGPSSDYIKKLLYNQYVIYNNDQWDIYENNVSDFEVLEQNTDIDSQIDNVIVSLTLDDDVEKLKCDLMLHLKFDKEWILNNIDSLDNCEVIVKDEKKASISQESIMSLFNNKELLFDKNSKAPQKFSISESEIEDFSIQDEKTENKGKVITNTVSIKIKKPIAKLSIVSPVRFEYSADSGWVGEIDESNMIIEALDVDVVGLWSGRYNDVPFSGDASLDLSVNDDGNYLGTYSFTSDSDFTGHGSYEVSGKLDLSSLSLALEPGEWIDNPPRDNWDTEKRTVTVICDINSASISGKGQGGKRFEMSK